MPTYQYACTSQACGLRFERVQAFTDSAITECPECSDRVRKVYGSVGVVFKGSGFYRTDSRDAKAGAKAKADSDSTPVAKDAGKSAEPSKANGGSSSGKADSSSGSAGSGESKSNGKSASASKTAATAAS